MLPPQARAWWPSRPASGSWHCALASLEAPMIHLEDFNGFHDILHDISCLDVGYVWMNWNVFGYVWICLDEFHCVWICLDEFHWNPGFNCVWMGLVNFWWPLSLVEVMFLDSSWGICWNFFMLCVYFLKGLLQINSPYSFWVLLRCAFLTFDFLKLVVARPLQCGDALASPFQPTCCRECNFEWQIWYCQDMF